jgi:hypothetical protein
MISTRADQRVEERGLSRELAVEVVVRARHRPEAQRRAARGRRLIDAIVVHAQRRLPSTRRRRLRRDRPGESDEQSAANASLPALFESFRARPLAAMTLSVISRSLP